MGQDAVSARARDWSTDISRQLRAMARHLSQARCKAGMGNSWASEILAHENSIDPGEDGEEEPKEDEEEEVAFEEGEPREEKEACLEETAIDG